MKKLILLLLTFSAFMPGIQAQETAQAEARITVNRIRLGAFVAPNVSWMHPTANKSDDGLYNVSSQGSKVGFTYGLIAEYYFAHNYAIVTGLQVSSTGGKINAERVDLTTTNNTSQVQKADFDYRLQFLEVPIALKLRTDDINGFKFFGQLGVSLGFNIGKKADYTVSYYDGDMNQTRSVSDEHVKLTGTIGTIAPVMLAMNLGGGAEYPINNKLTVFAGLYFVNGFTPDATAPQKYDNDRLGYKGDFRDANTRLNNFSLRVGLFF